MLAGVSRAWVTGLPPTKTMSSSKSTITATRATTMVFFFSTRVTAWSGDCFFTSVVIPLPLLYPHWI